MSDKEPRDADLVARTRAGATDGFELLYRRHLPALHDFLCRVTRDATTAEDLAQTAFLTAFERLETLNDPERFRPWLYSIAHHLAMNHFTRSKPATAYEQSRFEQDDARSLSAGDEGGPEAGLAANEAVELVWAAAGGLGPRQYAVLDLTLRRGMTTPQVAEVLDVPPRHAAVLVHRAREALGSAVRALLVARNRGRCPKLAALVPTPVGSLTPELRTTVDHHMRRCPACRGLAAELVAPEALLAAAPLFALPHRLAEASWAEARSSCRERPTRTPRRARTKSPRPRLPHLVAGKPLLWAAAVAALAGSAVTAAVMTSPGHPVADRHPAATTHATTTATTRSSRRRSRTRPRSRRHPSPPTSPNTIPLSTAAAGGWTAEASGTTEQLSAVSCPTAELCVAVGAAGTILFSGDGGARWATASSESTATLRGVACEAGGTCVAVGGRGTIVVTSDAGRSWHKVASGVSGDLNAVSCAGLTCWAVGAGVAAVSHNGGNSFEAAAIAGTGGVCAGTTNACLNAVVLESPLAGYAAGGSSDVFATTNGADWSDAVHGTAGWFTGVSCATSDCIAVGVAPSTITPSVLVETSGAWAPVTVLPPGLAPLAAVNCVSSTCIAVGGAGTVIVSRNGGRAWRADSLASPVALAGAACAVSGTCVAVGSNGAIERAVRVF